MAISRAQEFEDSLIGGPADGEPESRIKTELHIFEILVGKGLQNHSGNRGCPGLAVGTVPEAPAGPLGIERAADVLDNLCLHEIRQHPAFPSALPVGIFVFIVSEKSINSQGAYDRVIRKSPGVRMEGE